MHRAHSSRHLLLCALFAFALAFAGCSSSPTSTSTSTGGGTSTPHPTATTAGGGSGGGSGATPTPAPAVAPPHAFAWYQYDSASVPQIWASLNGGVPAQITHVAADHSVCVDQIAWSPPVFSPDLTHIVAALGSFNCGDGVMSGAVAVVTVSSGAVAVVPGSGGTNDIRINQREAGWVNNSTIWYINYNGLYTYPLGGGSATLVNALSNPEEGALRGSTFFWSNGGQSGPQHLQRFDLSSHSALPGVISLGSTGSCACSPGDYRTPGWDASADGSHVVYQVATPSSAMPGGVASSTFYYANADGSGASQIAHVVVTNHAARLLLSPNGARVAMSAALPSPSVITASVSSPGTSSDPNMHFYHPDGVAFPVWKWDSSTFWVATKEDTEGLSAPAGNIYAFTVASTSSTLAQSGAYNPWYTIGG